jgi:nitrogen regulatory protein PII
MKLLAAIIDIQALERVKNALNSLDVHDLTVVDAKHYGRETHTEHYRGELYVVDFVQKVKLEAMLPDELSTDAIAAVKTGCDSFGDPKIMLTDLVHGSY